MTSNLRLKSFYDTNTNTLTYVVYNNVEKDAIIIDPVLDYDPHGSVISYESIDRLLQFIQGENLKVTTVLETHAHADHLSSAVTIQETIPGVKIGIGENIKLVQKTFRDIYNLKDLNTDGSQFDYLLKDGEVKQFGSISVKTIATPGHTPACSCYLIEDMLFTGDSLFLPDGGTGRCDFPQGSADQLFKSIKEKIYTLPDETRIFVGHDYQPEGREVRFESTIAESKKRNIQLNKETTATEFLEFRNKRDKNLSAPKLLFQSIQVNIDGGRLPIAEDNQRSYLKMPLKLKGRNNE